MANLTIRDKVWSAAFDAGRELPSFTVTAVKDYYSDRFGAPPSDKTIHDTLDSMRELGELEGTYGTFSLPE